MYYHEVRTDVARQGEPILVLSDEELEPGCYNFRSTFDYPQEVADSIRSRGNTQDLRGQPVSTKTILIDVDDPANVDEVRDILLAQQVLVEEYQTGNRGAHFHVPLAERITGVDVVYSVTAWLKDIGAWTLIDPSVYREGGQFRLESATHAKTGKAKVLVDLHDNEELLRLEVKTTPPRKIIPKETVVTGDKRDFFLNLMERRGVGQRHLHMYIIWNSGLRAGFDNDVLEESLTGWNDRQDDPHSNEMLAKKIESFCK